MRKLKLQMQLSIDGFVAGVNGEMDWMEMNWDEAIIQHVTAFTEPVDTIILGRKLAEGFIPYWASNPDQPGADKFNNTPKVVFTKTIDKHDWKDTTLAKGDLVEEISKLKQQPGGDIAVYGGGSFVSSLVKHNLIDEYHLLINPSIVGNGMPIFKAMESVRKMKLVNTVVGACGIVVLQYEPGK